MSVEELTAQIESMRIERDTVVAERDGTIAVLSSQVGERDGVIAILTGQLAERDGVIAELTKKLAEKDGLLSEYKDAFIDQLRRLLK